MIALSSTQMQAAQQPEHEAAVRVAAAPWLPDDPQSALTMHQNPHNVTTAFEAAFGDGLLNSDNAIGGSPSQSIDSRIGWGGLARVGVGACISIDDHGNLMAGRGREGRGRRRRGRGGGGSQSWARMQVHAKQPYQDQPLPWLEEQQTTAFVRSLLWMKLMLKSEKFS